ncbi:DNA polymerase I [Gleimia sp. 6138-11-ORH1]|uniref:DNA polymerase I n=1 Tax=Gleimia sp. 6138-11-ORH1 TaxID=2973937 RepID=UPI00216A8CCF|nr:DNA polymerase I [Gleimia sp. 6138-11-ORH1]MCS4484298.1 DNA polymerase I [Gleimia sp. 6138-11-ORH1]
MSEAKLLIIDGHSMAFRAFFALPVENFTTSTGQATNAIYGFVTMMLRLIEEHQPTHLAVAFDTSNGSFRNEEYSEYKAGRAETPQEFKGQVGLIKQVLENMGITWLTADGYEADDILATLATLGEAKDMDVLLASGDRDSFQLISDKVKVIYPGRTPADLKLMDAAAVEARYGVPPQWYPHIAALTGEKADNLPGVPGVGEKTAAQWVQQYGGLEGVIANADKIKGKRGEALREAIPAVERNRRLNQLLTDVKLPVSVEELQRTAINRSGLNELFDVLEFNRLRQRVFALDGETGEENSDSRLPEVEITTQTDLKQLASWVEKIPAGEPLVLATEVLNREVEAICLYYATAKAGFAFACEPRDLDAVQTKHLEGCLASHPIITHDAKGLRHAFKNSGLNLPAPADDVELAAYLLGPDQRDYSLRTLAEKYLGIFLAPQEEQLTLLRDYVSLTQSAQVIARLAVEFKRRLQRDELWDLYRNLELPVQSDLYELEDTGIAMSMEVLNQLLSELTEQVERAEEAAYNAIGHKVNLSSPMQLQTVLFEELQMPKTKRTKRGYTTNAEALADLYAKTQHPFLKYLLEHRDKIKLRQIVEGLINAVREDGRIHTTFQQTVAATGRLSSTEPNLQNIPARTAEGMRIRAAFVPGQGYDQLMTVDYSQIEMRLMAHMSGDQGLIDAFNSGEDLHRTTAAMVFGVPEAEVTPALRSQIKATSYGLAYGLSSYGLSQQLGIPVPEAAKLKADYLQRFGGVAHFLEKTVEDARGRGYTSTMMGRRRYLPDLNAANQNLRAMAQRAALNAPIQGTAADIIKLAMHQVMQKFKEAKLASRVLLQVHDELVLEVVDSEIAEVTKIVTELMGSVVQLSVPLDVSVGVGSSWQDAAH